MTEVKQPPDGNVQVALTLVSAGYMAEGMSPGQKLQVMSKALNVQGLPTAGRWKIVWGPAEGREFDQWFIAEGPDAQGAPTLALVIRGTQMHQWASIKHDLEIGMAPLPLPSAKRHSDAVMKNLVGPEELALWPEILATPGLIPHHYGKAEARPGRKMGHVTRLFPYGALPGDFGVADALGVLAGR